MKRRGATGIEIIILIAAIGVSLFAAFKPASTHGESRRADQSQKTTEELVAAITKQGAEAAASVVKIQEANATAPESPEKSFISQESGVALSKLPTPDPVALLEAERRKNAVLEGRLEEAAKLYDLAYKRSAALEQVVTKTLAAKRASDDNLQQVAAMHLGMERQRNQIAIIAGLLLVLWLWTKTTHFSPRAIAEAVSDIKQGATEPIQAVQAIDGAATRLQQRIVSRLVKLKSK